MDRDPSAGAFLSITGNEESVDRPYAGVERRTQNTPGATVARYRFQPAASFPRHVHDQEQITIVLAGQLTFDIGDDVCEMGAGDVVLVPGGVAHGLTAGADGAEIVALIIPPRTGNGDIAVLDSSP
jgi:quercetin dioxygenase-like cupin family protein